MLLFDTDIMIYILRGHPAAIAWLGTVRTEEIVLPGYVAMELIQGCRDHQEQRDLLRELRRYTILWPQPEACNRALDLYTRFHLSHGLDLLDALIGQLALELDLPLHTFNEKHYRAIPRLNLVQPYTR